MFFASYGPPPENPAEIRLKTLRQFADLQGGLKRAWQVKPYCPHCAIPTDAWNIKAAMEWREAAEEFTSSGKRRRSPGFGHKPRSAKKDCPWNFADDPRYKHVDDATKRTNMVALNRAALSDPRMKQAAEDIIEFLLTRVTGSAVLSPQDQKMLKLAKDEAITLPGLFKRPELYAPLVVSMFGSRLRTFGQRESLNLPPEPEQSDFIGVPTEPAQKKKHSRHPLREVGYEGVGAQFIDYEIDGKQRREIVPLALALCVIARGDEAVKHVPIHSGRDKKIVEFPLTTEFLRGIAKNALKRRRKDALKAELKAKLPGYSRGQPKPGKPVAKSQLGLI